MKDSLLLNRKALVAARFTFPTLHIPAGVSHNAFAQALKMCLVSRGVTWTQDAFLSLLGKPRGMTTVLRYCTETYNILPWDNRTRVERAAALRYAHRYMKSLSIMGLKDLMEARWNKRREARRIAAHFGDLDTLAMPMFILPWLAA